MSDFLRPHGLQHARPPCPSPTPRVYSDSCPLSWWCHPTILSSVVPFSSLLQSFPASESFQMSQFFASGGRSIGVSALASVLAKKSQGWSLSEWTGWMILNEILPHYHILGASLWLWIGVSFFGGIQHSPVNGCSAVSCHFGVLTGEDENMSFYSATFCVIRWQIFLTQVYETRVFCIAGRFFTNWDIM